MGRRGRGDTALSDARAHWRIVEDDLTHPQVVVLLDLHVRAARANSPPGGVFALDLTGLHDPAVTVWSLWEGEALLGLGALKRLDAVHVELKSMRTAPDHLRRGVGSAMLAHLISEARGRGYRRISLETGGNAAFSAARALYADAGFAACGPFADYSDTSFSRYYSRTL